MAGPSCCPWTTSRCSVSYKSGYGAPLTCGARICVRRELSVCHSSPGTEPLSRSPSGCAAGAAVGADVSSGSVEGAGSKPTVVKTSAATSRGTWMRPTSRSSQAMWSEPFCSDPASAMAVALREQGVQGMRTAAWEAPMLSLVPTDWWTVSGMIPGARRSWVPARPGPGPSLTSSRPGWARRAHRAFGNASRPQRAPPGCVRPRATPAHRIRAGSAAPASCSHDDPEVHAAVVLGALVEGCFPVAGAARRGAGAKTNSSGGKPRLRNGPA
ncbi:hypothetical protein SAMN04487980_105413 [Streptomyces sp. cf124]|nr:hypothetical protein SAMN04487980_105413 [Streptomyces sp. cf124]